MKKSHNATTQKVYETILKPFICSDAACIPNVRLKGRLWLQLICVTCANILFITSSLLFDCYDSRAYLVTLIMIFLLLGVIAGGYVMNCSYCRILAGITIIYYLLFLHPGKEADRFLFSDFLWICLLVLFSLAIVLIISKRCFAICLSTVLIVEISLFVKDCLEQEFMNCSCLESVCPQLVSILITLSVLLLSYGPWIHYGGIEGVIYQLICLDEEDWMEGREHDAGSEYM